MRAKFKQAIACGLQYHYWRLFLLLELPVPCGLAILPCPLASVDATKQSRGTTLLQLIQHLFYLLKHRSVQVHWTESLGDCGAEELQDLPSRRLRPRQKVIDGIGCWAVFQNVKDCRDFYVRVNAQFAEAVALLHKVLVVHDDRIVHVAVDFTRHTELASEHL